MSYDLNPDDAFYGGWENRYQGDDPEGDAWSADPQPFLAGILARIPPKSKVLDIGSGDGRNTKGLLQADCDVTVLDVAPTALQSVLKRMHDLGLKSPTAVQATAEHMPLASNQFDASICIDTLPQSRHIGKAVGEIHRVLKPGGICGVNVFSTKDCAFGEGEQIAPRSFLFKQTLFHFFEPGDMERFCAGLFNIVSMEQVSWEDPPHGAFRPYRHRHDAFVYVLQKP